jgi:ribosome-associated protein
MLQALADEVKERIWKAEALRGRVEGQPHDGWVLVDFNDVVVHLFSTERRNYYRLEDLWSKGKILLRLQ